MHQLTLEDAKERVKTHPLALQFKNALKYIQSGTNMGLERMALQLDVVLAEVYREAYKQGFGEGYDWAGGTKSLAEQYEEDLPKPPEIKPAPTPVVGGFKKV